MSGKSKIPDLNECTAMATKLFKDVKQSVSEIVKDYRGKRAQDASKPDVQTKNENNQHTDTTQEKRENSDQ